MSMFRKKPVVIEARQFSGWNPALIEWIDNGYYVAAGYDHPLREGRTSEFDRSRGDVLDDAPAFIVIPTLEGSMRADDGDWIIKGVQGEFYPCKPDIFLETYDKVED